MPYTISETERLLLKSAKENLAKYGTVSAQPAAQWSGAGVAAAALPAEAGRGSQPLQQRQDEMDREVEAALARERARHVRFELDHEAARGRDLEDNSLPGPQDYFAVLLAIGGLTALVATTLAGALAFAFKESYAVLYAASLLGLMALVGILLVLTLSHRLMKSISRRLLVE